MLNATLWLLDADLRLLGPSWHVRLLLAAVVNSRPDRRARVDAPGPASLHVAAVLTSGRNIRVDAAGSRATGVAGTVLAASRHIRIDPAGPAGIGIGVGLRTERRIHPSRSDVLTAIWETGSASAGPIIRIRPVTVRKITPARTSEAATWEIAPIAAQPVDGLIDDVIAVTELQPIGERQEYRTRDQRIDGTKAGPLAQAGGCSRVIAVGV